MGTAQKLDAIAEYESELDHLNAEQQRLLDEAVPAEIRARLAEIRTEFSGKAEAVAANITALKDEISADVLAKCETVKGQYYMAVWSKGRVSWDGKKLDGMMSIIPALKDARKEGEPGVSFRRL